MKCTINEFIKRIERYESDLVILLNNINIYQGYQDTVFERDQYKQDILADKQLSILLTQADITIGMKNILTCKGVKAHFEEYYFARILALNCYEILDSHYKSIFDKNLQEYKIDERTSTIMKELTEIQSQLNIICGKYKPYLGEIRHNVIAHRHLKSGLEQNKLMWSINPQKILNISREIQENYILMMPLFDKIQKAII